jgi:hypothetical protein
MVRRSLIRLSLPSTPGSPLSGTLTDLMLSRLRRQPAARVSHWISWTIRWNSPLDEAASAVLGWQIKTRSGFTVESFTNNIRGLSNSADRAEMLPGAATGRP